MSWLLWVIIIVVGAAVGLFGAACALWALFARAMSKGQGWPDQ